jgi:hypothetical protein
VYGSGEAGVELNDAFHVGDVALEVWAAYKYLGMEVEENLMSWKAFKERTLTKATKVMRASWGMGLQSGCMSVKGGAKLWTTFARPILEYGAEIWEREGDHKWDKAERIQKEMGVKILRCSKTVADAFVRGELGWWTLRARRVMLRLRYWGKLVRMDNSRLAKKVYCESKRDHDDCEGKARLERHKKPKASVRNWCSYTHELLRTVGLDDHWDNLTTVADAAEWAALVAKKVAKWEHKRWRKEVTANKVLEVYAQLKTDWGRETYLDGHDDPTGRMWLARLRSGRHGLAVNTGRYMRPKTPREDRVCTWCVENEDVRVVEDESHVLLVCRRYDRERREMLEALGQESCDGSMEALQVFFGQGVEHETEGERQKRHKEAKRFVRRILHVRLRAHDV